MFFASSHHKPWQRGLLQSPSHWDFTGRGQTKKWEHLSHGELSAAAWPSGVCWASQGALATNPACRLLAESVSAPDSPLAHWMGTGSTYMASFPLTEAVAMLLTTPSHHYPPTSVSLQTPSTQSSQKSSSLEIWGFTISNTIGAAPSWTQASWDLLLQDCHSLCLWCKPHRTNQVDALLGLCLGGHASR